ncbi:MAG: hypothetical protein MJA83_17905 [Gammaproteobacteria bacterium]|nr:hypothetical protein [Gammaproteobacteria bacterium]
MKVTKASELLKAAWSYIDSPDKLRKGSGVGVSSSSDRFDVVEALMRAASDMGGIGKNSRFYVPALRGLERYAEKGGFKNVVDLNDSRITTWEDVKKMFEVVISRLEEKENLRS